MSQIQNRIGSSYRVAVGVACLAIVGTVVRQAPGVDEPGATGASKPPSQTVVDPYNLPQETRAEVMAWFDTYLRTHVLFTDETIKAMRAKINAMPTDEFHEWLVKTQQVRAELSSPEWLETETWLKETLKVSATYSDEEIAEFRQQAGQMSPAELLDLIAKIRDKHLSLRWRNKAFQEQRQSQVIARDRMVAQRAKAQRAAAARSSRSHALYGANQGHAARRAQGRPYAASQVQRYNRPLVTGRDVARRSVMRGMGYRW